MCWQVHETRTARPINRPEVLYLLADNYEVAVCVCVHVLYNSPPGSPGRKMVFIRWVVVFET